MITEPQMNGIYENPSSISVGDASTRACTMVAVCVASVLGGIQAAAVYVYYAVATAAVLAAVAFKTVGITK